jgi:hypothetical protein
MHEWAWREPSLDADMVFESLSFSWDILTFPERSAARREKRFK